MGRQQVCGFAFELAAGSFCHLAAARATCCADYQDGADLFTQSEGQRPLHKSASGQTGGWLFPLRACGELALPVAAAGNKWPPGNKWSAFGPSAVAVALGGLAGWRRRQQVSDTLRPAASRSLTPLE